LLVSWCAGGRCGMTFSDKNHGRSRRPGVEDRGWSHRSDTRWLGGWVAPCAVYTWHVETRSTGFFVEPQNQGRRFVSGLSSNTRTVFSSLALKLVAMVSPGLSSKPEVGFLVEPYNQGGGGFLGLGLKTESSGLVIWASKSP
jgi:hypothetical protein